MLSTLVPDSTSKLYNIEKTHVYGSTYKVCGSYDNIYCGIEKVNEVLGVSLSAGRRMSSRIYAGYKEYMDAMNPPRKM